jgi:Swt1-like HEPN
MKYKVWSILNEQGHDIPDELIHLYLAARDPRPDLYTLICNTEVLLHRLVRQTLQTAYGDHWWRKGIPESTRKNCQNRKEEDEMPLDDPYRYTTLTDLKSIIENDWRVFSIALPKALAAKKPETLHRLKRLNDIRKKVMHPVKEISEYENDYRFARELLANLDDPLWRVDDAQPVQRL